MSPAERKKYDKDITHRDATCFHSHAFNAIHDICLMPLRYLREWSASIAWHFSGVNLYGPCHDVSRALFRVNCFLPALPGAGFPPRHPTFSLTFPSFRRGPCFRPGASRPFAAALASVQRPAERYAPSGLSFPRLRHPTNRRLAGPRLGGGGPFRSHGRGRPCRPQASDGSTRGTTCLL